MEVQVPRAVLTVDRSCGGMELNLHLRVWKLLTGFQQQQWQSVGGDGRERKKAAGIYGAKEKIRCVDFRF